MDRGKLGQALANLIGNACQHGEVGAPIEVTLGVQGDDCVVAIRNRGKPIPPPQLKEIFEPFRRLAGDKVPGRSTNSLGLGLYIAKSIVTAHHGTIEVSSADDATTFTVRLPRKP